MKALTYIFIFLFGLLTFNTNAQTMNEDDFKAVASDLCDCGNDLLDLYEKMKKYGDEGNTEALQKNLPLFEKESMKLEACVGELEKKYPHLDGNKEYEAKAEEALRTYCPRFSLIMDAGNNDESQPLEEEAEQEVGDVAQTKEELTDEYFNEAAHGFCDCTSKVFETGTKVSELKSEGKEEEAIKLQASMETELAKMSTCVEALMVKYPELESSEENKKRSTDALVKVCPHFFKSAD